MPQCKDYFEPECAGEYCIEWGFCPASLDMMFEDSSVREEWIKGLKSKDMQIPKGATAAWRKFLREKRKQSSLPI